MPRNVALILLGVASLVAAALLAYWTRGTWFQEDDLAYAVRLSTQSLGHAMVYPPSNKYLIAVPLLLYKGMFEAFGLDSFIPYRAVNIALVLLSAWLLFALLRRRVGDLWALPPAILMLFFGAGWGVVITPERIPSQIALAAGLGMLVVIERRDLRGDLAAAGLLAISLASHPIGIAFAAATAAMILLRPSPERWGRTWVFLVPVVLYAAWWLVLRPAGSPSYSRATDVVAFVAQSWVAVTAAVSGLFGVLDGRAYQEPLGWIVAGLLLVLMGAGAAAAWRRLPATFWASLAALVVMMVAPKLSPGGILRAADEPRYLYPAAFLVLLMLGDLAGSVRPPKWAMWAGTAVLALSLLANVDRLADASRDVRATSDLYKAEWGAVEIAGRGTQPGFRPEFYLPTAQEYFTVVDAYGGTAAYTPDELGTRPPLIRAAADRVLVGALGLQLAPTSAAPPHGGDAPRVARTLTGSARTRSGCVQLRPAEDLPSAGEPAAPPLAELDVPNGGVWIGGDRLAEAGFLVGRIADAPAIRLPPPTTGKAAILRIPVDAVRLPWRLLIASPRSVAVCGLHR
jgi:hypothetical protein